MTEATTLPIEPLSAPLVVSVTGHRDICDQKELIKPFGWQLELIEKGEAHGAKNCILLSALASGADTLAAHIAWERGWQVIAPLPLPDKEYRRDFEDDDDPAALRDFDDLLEKCPHFFVGYAPGCTPENTRANGEFRDRQYAFLGEFLTRHAEVLIAFWDGHDIQKMGGTSDVVRMQREGIRPDIIKWANEGNLLDAPEGGSVIVISSKRKSHSEPESQFRGIKGGKHHGSAEPLPALTNGQKPEQIKERRKHWEQFVKDAAGVPFNENSAEIPAALANGSSYLKQVREAFLRADALAGQFQTRTKARFNAVLGAGLAFTLFVSVALAEAWQKEPWINGPLVACWVSLLLAWGLVKWDKKTEATKRYFDSRSLAEAWRVTFYWRALGIEEPLDPCYLRSQRGELDWIRQALRISDLKWRAQKQNLGANAKGFPTVNSPEFGPVFDKWITGQTNHFKSKFPQDREYLTSLRNWSWAFLIFGLGASALDTWAQMHAGVVALSVWGFATRFAGANALTSPLVPGVLSLVHMSSWPVATKDNTKEQGGITPDEIKQRRKLRSWFIRQSAAWKFVAVAGGLLMLAVAGAFYAEPSLATQQSPLLQVMATICFFLPALIFAYANFKALPEHVKLFERSFRVFEQAQKILIVAQSNSGQVPHEEREKLQDKAQLRIYRQLGREALHENGEWLLIHRDRPLDIEA